MCNQWQGSCSHRFHFVGLHGKTRIDLPNVRHHTAHFCHMGRMPLSGLHLKISPYPWCKWDHRNYSSHAFVSANVMWRSNRIMLKVLCAISVILLSCSWVRKKKMKGRKIELVVWLVLAKKLFPLNKGHIID